MCSLPRKANQHFGNRARPFPARILSGGEAAVAVNSVADFGVGGRNPNAAPAANSFEAMYQQSVDTVLHGTGKETFEAVRMLKSANPRDTSPRREQTIHADVSVRA
jgi:hypothetical protein